MVDWKQIELITGHETKVTSFKYSDDIPGRKKKGLLSGLLDKVKAVLHPA
ncbi:MAG: hypothetical protein PHH85_14470 [Candidatus Methanoperedens sp.]|nr:hypothetical protein [Candidatus Methanoperedens sp.]